MIKRASKLFTVILIIPLLIFACGQNELSDDQRMELAIKICQNTLILDSHIDWPELLLEDPRNISEQVNERDFDFVRAKTGGLDAPFSVIYVSAEYDMNAGRIIVDSLINSVLWYTKEYPTKCSEAKTPEEIKTNFNNKLLSLPLCLENGSPIGDDINYLKYLKDKGIIYITLTHSKTNQISDANLDSNRKWNGLSPFGINVIKEMNNLGIMIDISHSTDSAVFQALKHSKAPVIATHSSCRHFVPGFERNLSDTLIKSIADKNGVVMVIFLSDFLDSVCRNDVDILLKWEDSTGIDFYSKEGKNYIEEFAKTHVTRSDSKRLVDHIDHIVNLVGIDYVGLGSDYDGMGGPFQPSDLIDVSCYPVIVSELLSRGYTEEDIMKILSGNFFRVWREVLDVADSLKSNI
jgi:membrane dipeptidase